MVDLLIKKRIYSLLFSKPLFNYYDIDGSDYRLNVLICGDNKNAIEAFKAVYWCCQMPKNYSTTITVVSNSCTETRNQFNTIMPALQNNNVIDTKIDFYDYNALPSLAVDYRYIFICESNKSITEYFSDIIANLKNKKLICSMCKESSFIYKGQQVDMIDLLDNTKYDGDSQLLDRYAYNCDYAYSMGENERFAKKSFDEFVASEYNIENNDVARNKYYNYLSSLAFPVHIPYKLFLCGISINSSLQDDGMQMLLHSITKQDKLYNTLLYVEHMRWSAYMISEGWRMPNDDELIEFAYLNYGFPNGYNQKDNKRKLHPCICKGSDNNCILTKYNNLWSEIYEKGIFTLSEAKEYLSDTYYEDFSELETISLVLHSIVCLRGKEIESQFDNYYKFIDDLPYTESRKVYENLKKSANKLKSFEPNSSKLFIDSLNEAKKHAENDGLVDKIDAIEKAFAILVERNRNKNFYTIDSTMIDMIPFVIWYGIENKTVVTFSEGIVAEDVIIPTLLCAEKAIFVSADLTKKYKDSVKQYFSKRHITSGNYIPQNINSDTDVEFIDLKDNNQKYITDLLIELLNLNDGIAINCLINNSIPITMAIGAFSDKFNVPVYHYSRKNGIENIKNGTLITPGLFKKSFSVEEYFDLMGGKYTNIYLRSPFLREYNDLVALFKKHSEFKTFRDKNGKKKNFSAWGSVCGVFQNFGQKKLVEIRNNYQEFHYSNQFEEGIYQKCGLVYLFNQLEKYHIIKGLVVRYNCGSDKNLVNVQFKYYDSDLSQQLSHFDFRHTLDDKNRTECLRKMICFSTSGKDTISMMELSAKNVQICNQDENLELKKAKLSLIRDLEKCNIINNVSYYNNNCYASFNVDNFTLLKNIKNQGNIYEIMLYNIFKDSGEFDDVQTGVKISWTVMGKSLDDYLMEYILKSKYYGLNNFYVAQSQAKKMFNGTNIDVDTINEIDVVLMRGMVPTFISCKTEMPSITKVNNWLYEISSIANHFHANAVLALTVNLDEEQSYLCINRAKQMGISLIGAETVFDKKRMDKAIIKLANNNRIYGNETI